MSCRNVKDERSTCTVKLEMIYRLVCIHGCWRYACTREKWLDTYVMYHLFDLIELSYTW